MFSKVDQKLFCALLAPLEWIISQVGLMLQMVPTGCQKLIALF